MPDYKRQHYVPQLLLKKFSEDETLINIFNLSSQKSINNVPLKPQCYEDYFYGKDGELEKNLGELETSFSKIIKEIEDQHSLDIDDEKLDILYLFACIQLARTKQASDSLNERSSKLFKTIFKQKAEEDGIDLSSFDIEINEAIKHSIRFNLQYFPILLDLDIRLLKNQTSQEFVLSDNPVVSYNKFLHFRKGLSNTGLATKCLKLFLPISPTEGLLFFDPTVYSIRKNKQRIVKINNESDINNLNALQICNAVNNFYYKNEKFNYFNLYEKNKNYLYTESSKISSLTPQDKSSFIITTKVDIQINLQLTFLNLKTEAKKEQRKLRQSELMPGAILRNEELYNSVQKRVEKVNEQIKEKLLTNESKEDLR